MIQGGDLSSIPNISATTKKDHLILNKTKLYPEIIDTLIHEKGSLAAARFSDDINPQKLSSPSQFYIVHGTSLNESMIRKSRGINTEVLPSVIDKYLAKGGSPQLDGEYTVFGKVLYGMDIVDKIATSPTDSNEKPINDIRIISIKAIN
jgi:peptidyl-prolyl cis-trans isomerase B (cyclophilin B)